MITKVIYWSIYNRGLVLILALLLAVSGVFAIKNTPVDAIPDLSDVQVIVKATYPGQSPTVVQEQVTYPLTTAMLSVPGAKDVRAFSYLGDAFIYVIFDEDTDLYWARSRVQEYLTQASSSLPASVKFSLGPDASGVGWVYQYALVDRTQSHDLSELRSLQDWFLKLELQTVPGVSEVATVGGMVKQYQIHVDPFKLRAFGIPIENIQQALQQGNQESSASVIEMAEAEYMVTVNGYIQNIEDIKRTAIGTNANGIPLFIEDVADVNLGPEMRRGVAELNGEGEVVGGIVVMRYGENASAVIEAVKQKLALLSSSLPDGVEVVTVYDRSKVIQGAVNHLWQKLGEELLLVALVCLLFLFHLRSSIVAVVALPMGILVSFIVMYWQGINANIMSLGGIAIAIGAMTDGAIVMIENLHKHLANKQDDDQTPRWEVVAQAAAEVGPALFFSLLIITVSFLPVFILEAQEGRLFAPLAYTKTYAMAAAAGLSITLVPVLMGYLIKGHIPKESDNIFNRGLVALYRPLLRSALAYPKLTLLMAALVLVGSMYPLTKLGSEFMPELDEGDLLYMPTTYPSVSIGTARQLLQQTDRLIATLPEVDTVFGKVGRAETATDPAPLTMIETIIQLKPKSEWREGVTLASLKQELEQLVSFPGLSNAWVMPIKTRIDMLATGMKTPVGLKIAGDNLTVIEDIGRRIEDLLKPLDGTASVYSERVVGGRYIKIDINRAQAARYGLTIQDIHQVIGSAVGGKQASLTTEGQARYPINIRYPQSFRDSPEALHALPIVTSSNMQLTLGDIAHVYVESGPGVIKSENARLNGWVYIDIADIDVGSYVAQANALIQSELKLPPGYSLRWAGQYEYAERAKAKLMYVVPATLLIILFLLYLNFRRITDVAIILGTLPFAAIGAFWILYALDFHLSIAVGVGIIALLGVAVEIGVLMIVYLHQSVSRYLASSAQHVVSENGYKQALLHGATQRVRPVVMTVATIVIGLLPVVFGTGTGSEVMSRIAAPMVGGMLSALVLGLIVIPAVYLLLYPEEKLLRSE